VYALALAAKLTLAPAFLWSMTQAPFMMRLRKVTLFEPLCAMFTAKVMLFTRTKC
jgi:hypothetical protein